MRIKTEAAKNSYDDIEAYLSQLLSSQMGSKTEEESRSRSRIRERTQPSE